MGALPKRRKHLVAAFRLRIVRVLDLYPPVLRVNAGLPLAHNPLKIPLADLFKQQLAVTFNVLSIDDFKTLASFDQSVQLFLSFDQRHFS